MAIVGRWEDGEWKGTGWPPTRADVAAAVDPAAQHPCACGCARLANPGARYVLGHNGRKLGVNGWKPA